LLQPSSPDLVSVVQIKRKAQKFCEDKFAVIGHFFISTGLFCCG
jgi:hypothetical protein